MTHAMRPARPPGLVFKKQFHFFPQAKRYEGEGTISKKQVVEVLL
jgi:hypothetical protein